MTKEKTSPIHKLWTVLGILLCIILLPILIINCTLIIRSFTDKDTVPSFGSYLPMIVLTDSMSPEIQSGDLIICRQVDAEDVQVGDVISFFDPAGNGSSVVTHQVVGIDQEADGLYFTTRGIANNADDAMPVPAENLVGTYKTRIPGAGNIAMFMQTTPGLIVCVILPILLLIAYDMIRRRMYEKSKQKDTDALMAELNALRAEKEKQDASE